MKKIIFVVVVALFVFCGKAMAQHYTPQQCNTTPITTFPWTETFDSATNCWNICDEDDDNGITGEYCEWKFTTTHNHTSVAGSGAYISYSYYEDINNTTPEAFDNISNWLISPAIALPCQFTNATLTIISKELEQGREDYITIMISTTGNSIEDFQQWPGQNSTINYAGNATWRTDNFTIPSTLAGQTIHFAIHHNSPGQSAVIVDDISITVDGAVYTDTVNIDTSGCSTLVWQTVQFTHDTTFIQTIESNGNGCDTVQNVNIHVNPSYEWRDTVDLYGVTSFTLNSIDADVTFNTEWEARNSTIAGCDSNFYIVLRQQSSTAIDTISCTGSITIGGGTYSTDGMAYDTVQHIENGMLFFDAIRAYNMQISNGTTNETPVAESSYIHDGQTYCRTRTFVDPNNRCDSIRYVIQNPQSDIRVYDDSTVCGIGESVREDSVIRRNDIGCYDSIHVVRIHYRPSYEFFEDNSGRSPYQWHGRSLSNSATYYDSLTTIDGCDSIFTLNLTITGQAPVVNDTSNAPVMPLALCDTFAWHGHVYRATRDTAYDTIVYELTNHAPHDTLYTYNIHFNVSVKQYDTVTYTSPYFYHGHSYTTPGNHTVYPLNCDTTFYLNLTIVDALPCDTSYGPTQHPEGCDAVVWGGVTYRRETRLYDTLVNAVGCDSIRQVHIIVHQSFKDSNFFRPAAGSTYTWRGHQYTSNGTYYDSLTDQYGCDSIYAISLRWRPEHCVTVYDEVDTSDCGEVRWNRQTYTASTTLIDTLVSIDECDSIRTVNITVKRVSRRIIDTSGCEFLWYKGVLFRESFDSVTILGTLSNGCDSSEYINITINHNTNYIDTFVACERFRFGNTVFTSTQDYVGNPGANSQGCDSNINLHIIILHNISLDTQATVCDSMLWHGRYYTATGSYTHTDSAANGCDSTTTLRLTVNHSTHVDTSITACDFYTWYGENYTRSGDYNNVQPADAYGCAHHEALHLTIKHSTSVRIDTSVCDFLAWHANYFRTDTTATFVTTNRDHCDSVQYLTLRILHSSNTQRSVTACDSYMWHDSLFSATTDYTHHGINHIGCDSATTLHLTIVHSDTLDTTITACNSLRWHDSTYTTSTVDTFRVDDGNCRGAEILHLTLGRSSTNRFQQNVCDSLRWHDSLYTVSTTDMHTFTSAEGCDSIVTLALFVRYSSHATVNAAECNQYTWHGVTYTESTDTASFRRYNHAGCDSIVHLNLTIRHDANVIDTIHACERYVYNNRVYTEDGIIGTTQALTIYGCDSLTTLYLSIYQNGDSLIESKTVCNTYVWEDGQRYNNDTVVRRTVENSGCSNIHVLYLTVNHDLTLHDTIVACNEYVWSGRLYTYSTTETLTGTTREGCTQRNVMHLTINKDQTLVIDTSVCTSLDLGNGITYDANVSNLRRSMGSTVSGCDSTLLLTLRINGRYVDTNIMACNSVEWNGNTYLQSKNIIDTIRLDNGCDSIHAVNITVAYPSTSIDVLHACDSMTWRNGTTYYENTLLVDTIHVIDECDSIIYLSLKLDSSIHEENYQATNTAFIWDEKTYNISGDYTHTYTAANGCDSSVTVHLVVTNIPNPMILNHDQRLLMINHYPFGERGNRVDYYGYRWYCNGTPIEGANYDTYSLINGDLLNGCFYVEAAVDEELNAWLSSNLICLGNYGIHDVEAANVSFTAYPNPAKAGSPLQLSTTLDETRLTGATLSLFDHQGRQLIDMPYSKAATGLILPSTSGIYLLRLTTTDGLILATRIIVR